MERIVENVPSAVTLLKLQYRMHEQIMKFSYNEKYSLFILVSQICSPIKKLFMQ